MALMSELPIPYPNPHTWYPLWVQILTELKITVFYETCYPELFTAHTPCLPNLATWYRAMDAQRCGLYSGFIEENFEKITKNWKICNKIEKFRVLRSYEMGLS